MGQHMRVSGKVSENDAREKTGKIAHQLKSSFFCQEHLGVRPRDWSHWIRLEIRCHFMVFMCPELRYGPGSDKNRFWDTPSKNKLKARPIFDGI